MGLLVVFVVTCDHCGEGAGQEVSMRDAFDNAERADWFVNRDEAWCPECGPIRAMRGYEESVAAIRDLREG